VAELKARRPLRRAAPYVPPTAGRAGKLRLDFNENTVGCSPKVVRFLRRALDRTALATYPEYGATTRRLAAFLDVPPERLLLTNGTDEAIHVLLSTYVSEGDEVVVLQPSYAMYRVYAQAAGAAVRAIPYRGPNLEFPLEELLHGVTRATRAVLLANPGNPTGTAADLPALERIARKASNAAVLIDEAYFEFYGITALGLIERLPNLFVSRTFSKAFGLAALRLGCLVTQAANIACLRKAQSPYSVNALALLAARAALADAAYVRRYVTEVRRARTLLTEGLERLGVPYVPSQANFVLLRAGRRAPAIRDRLRARGVLVRDRSSELDGCIRVTVGTRPQVRRFLEELEKIWQCPTGC
jgi:histidinol-phosphate aminotransferase